MSGALVQKEVLRDKIGGVVREWILDGTLAPGERIVEYTLAARLGVSRPPLREALWQLAREGLVRIDAHHGARVTRLSADELREIFEVREVLETHAAKRIRAAAGPAQRAALDQAMARLRRASRARDLRRWVEADHHFHRTLWDLAGNRQLAATLEEMSARFFSYGLMRDLAHAERFRFDDMDDEHARLCRLVLRGSDAEIEAGFRRAYATFLDCVLERFGEERR
jgi:DNA-binding GntR family transcriptional regulator